MRMTYYAIDGQGPWRERLITREGPSGNMKVISDTVTGVTYKTWRSAVKALDSKNTIAAIDARNA